jgi:hypothetical protein
LLVVVVTSVRALRGRMEMEMEMEKALPLGQRDFGDAGVARGRRLRLLALSQLIWNPALSRG